MLKKRKIMATSALIYANGPLHLGHLVEYIQADIWVRFQRLIGNDCIYICGSDAHGTPIMISAQKAGITPEELINQVFQEHKNDFADFLISFDNFYTTHSEENRKLSENIYEKLRQRGDISTKTIAQAYDPVTKMFLPDRFVKGDCPNCGAQNQYGDSCEVCGAIYSPTELQNPISILSNTAPIQKESVHYFFDLPNYTENLKNWMSKKHLQEEIINKLNEWFDAGLQAWDISRDAPYFGFEIPDAPGKYFYVWLDAPIGYFASLVNLAERNKNINVDEYINKDSPIEMYHFIGKDIVYFHALFWPAMLMSANLRTPTAVWAHGFLTINGQKMSKSRGTYITAKDYLAKFSPEYLRYYYASKLNNRIEDIDLNFTDFMHKINADLVGKVINIASRCSSFIHKYFDNQLSETLINADIFNEFVAAGEAIAEYYENREFQKAVKDIMTLADAANQYINDQKPWALVKDPSNLKQVQDICTLGLNLFYVLMIYLKPILPQTAKAVEKFLNIPETTWQSRKEPLVNKTINTFEPLLHRIALEKIAEFHTIT